MRSRWRRPLVGYGLAIVAVAVVSLFIDLVLRQVSSANLSMLYLLAVMGTAVTFGRGPAVFASIAAFLTFDWFFVEPRHQLTVADPGEWISLLLFLLTAIVTGQLAAGQRLRAQEAQDREHEAVVLYDLVRILSEADVETVLPAVAERLREELAVEAFAIDLSRSPGDLLRIGAGAPEGVRQLQLGAAAAGHVLQTGPSAADGGHATPGRWARVIQPTRSPIRRDDMHLVPVRVGNTRVGALLMLRRRGQSDAVDDRLLSAAAAQIGQAVERDRLRKEAVEAEILRRTDALRTALLNAVSHDLRTPLATIMASAGSLLQDDVEWSANEQHGFAQAIQDEADHLNRLVGNLLDLSRIEAGSLRPHKSWNDLPALLEDVLDRLRPVVQQHHVQLTVDRDVPVVLLDPVEIGEVMYNLVENAAKYSPPDMPIEIEALRDGVMVRVMVSDHGAGIPQAALAHLFDPFYRVLDKPTARGLGLGLAVVKGLVEAHGGRVWAENRAGGGARFTFTLPLGQPQAEVA